MKANPKGKTDAEVRNEERLVKLWLKRDIFDLVGITASIMKGDEPTILRQLKTQYRMHPDISQLINYLADSPKGEGKFRLSDGPNNADYGK